MPAEAGFARLRLAALPRDDFDHPVTDSDDLNVLVGASVDGGVAALGRSVDEDAFLRSACARGERAHGVRRTAERGSGWRPKVYFCPYVLIALVKTCAPSGVG